jgi:hypothetical protein
MAIVLWPVLLFVIMLFLTGVINGFDRKIIYSFLLGLAKVVVVLVIIIFIAVDFKKTFGA